MGYSTEFVDWDQVTLEDLVVAYRKAKADCYYENTFPTAIKFADFEQDLHANLSNLLNQLHENDGFSGVPSLLGDLRVIPKKLGSEQKIVQPGHVHFSDAHRSFNRLIATKSLVPEFRVIGDFPVEAHVISALWINLVGHKFDSCLSENCYGARLRRFRNDDELESANHPFHITAIGSFEHYARPYQQWRSDGLSAIRRELESERNVLAASLDLKSYYHFIDPNVFSSVSFQEQIGLKGENELTPAERKFTDQLVKFFADWSKHAGNFIQEIGGSDLEAEGGLAIGLTASRVLSNVLLQSLDNLIEKELSPIFYGRYVDDMFLVLRDPEDVTNAQEFVDFIAHRIGKERITREAFGKKDGGGTWLIQLGEDYQGRSKLQLQEEKQKLFLLSGRAGLDLLDSIEKEIYKLTSEHRLMPSPDDLEDSTAARVLSAAGDASEQADTLRRADGLTIRRLSWALQLRHVETLARDLPANEWADQRTEFYKFAHNHILRPDALFSHYTHLPRLLAFPIALSEWRQAERIVSGAFNALQTLADVIPIECKALVNGREIAVSNSLWTHTRASLAWSFIDAAARNYDPDRLLFREPEKQESRLAALFVENVLATLETFSDIIGFRIGREDFFRKAPLLAKADLARRPYKQLLKSRAAKALLNKKATKDQKKIVGVFKAANLIDFASLEEFVKETRKVRLASVPSGHRGGESLLPFVFPTRPYTPAEISEMCPSCYGLGSLRKGEVPAAKWARFVRAVRGVWVRPSLLSQQTKQDAGGRASRYVRIGNGNRKKVTVALTNFYTSDTAWAHSAGGKPQLTRERYRRVADLVNQAIKIRPKPDYVLFPELSIPHAWLESVAGSLERSKISLICGTEYTHINGNEIFSEAFLNLSDDRLGFPTFSRIRQQKLEPAVREEQELTTKFGRHWYQPWKRARTKPPKRPVYNHDGFHFGMLICSELQDIRARSRFQGKVDGLLILSWNQDIETFSALVESSALDVHSYIVLVNNRKYGDSRVRSPARPSFKRDLARLRGGDNDFCVVVTLEYGLLREFQSRAKRWLSEGDYFKPVAEGFKISKFRRANPPQ